MKAKNFENNLALIGALIVLVGVSFVAIHDAGRSTISGAAKANADAAAAAAKSLAVENWMALDIKLQDRTSTLVADQN